VLRGKLLPSDGAAADFFGYAIALDQQANSGSVIVGADLAKSALPGFGKAAVGAAYVFGVPVGTHTMSRRRYAGGRVADEAALIFVYVVLALGAVVGAVQLLRNRDEAVRAARECCKLPSFTPPARVSLDPYPYPNNNSSSSSSSNNNNNNNPPLKQPPN
jgi:hypothetical protein